MTALFRSSTPPLSWYRIDFGRELDVDDVHRLIISVLGDRQLGLVIIEVENRKGSLSYRIGAHSSRIVQLIESAVAGSIVTEITRSVPADGLAACLRISTKRRPIRVDDPEASTMRILGALATTNAAVVHQIVIDRRLRPNAIPNRLETLQAETWPRALLEAATTGTSRVDTEARRALTDKESLPGGSTTVRVIATGRSARQALSSYEAALRSLESPGVRIRLARDDWNAARAARPSRRPTPLNSDEIVNLLAWPYGDRDYIGLDRGGSRLTAVTQPERFDRVLAVASHPGRPISIGQSAADGLRHTHVLGPTGVGKSTLLLNMILQDIEAGRGAVVLDPKGDLIDDVLARLQDRHLDRMVVLDAARSDHVVGFNPLKSRHAELAVDGILHVFHQLYADSWGPRTQDILHSSLLTVVDSEAASICHIPQLLVDDRFRRRLLAEKSQPTAVRFFWNWYENLSDAERGAVIAPVMNKLRPFLLRSSLRALLGQVEPAFDPKTIFTERRVLLVPLRKGLVGAEAANLLGSLIVARIWQLAQERSEIDSSRRHPVFVYLDEFQDYLHLPTDLADVLAQARGLGLGLVLAHQHLGQLTTSVRDAVLANAQSRICFRLSPDDATRIARSAGVLDADDFTRLGKYEVYASILTDGSPTPFASARTAAPRRPLRDPSAIGRDLARRWGRAPGDVDEQLNRLTNSPSDEDEQLGRRRRGQP
ncbi:MAG: type IV secretion system DNA-binding domain-containing protein [Acidimicrobiales bacterium]|nr:type IV secretion system DNA-binding domain-containing protein [Acidimicrobiales bacterium]